MKGLQKVWEAIKLPFVSLAVWMDESKRIDEDGTWSEGKSKRKHNAPERN